jgi:hypothetical protein
MQGQPTTPPTDAQPPGETIRSGAVCIQCGYALDGLHRGGVCPECGTAIARSFGGDSLSDSPHNYLHSIASGILCMQFSVVVGVALLGLMAVGMFFGMMLAIGDFISSPMGGGSSTRPIEALLVLGLVAMAVLAITSCVGAMMFTAADPGGVETEESRRDRFIIRTIAVIQCGVNLLVLSLPALGPSILDSGGSFLFFAIVVSLLLQPIQVIAATSRAGWLFSRVPSSRGVRRARSYVVLLPILMIFGSIVLIGPLVAMFLHMSLLSRLRFELANIMDRRDGPTADKAPRLAPSPRPDFQPPLLQDRTL